jgi:outer membrane protein OmpA-like peptidoglycan-associated protein
VPSFSEARARRRGGEGLEDKKKNWYPEMSHAACQFAEKDGTDGTGGVALPAAPSIEHLQDAKETPVASLPGGQRLAIHGGIDRPVACKGGVTRTRSRPPQQGRHNLRGLPEQSGEARVSVIRDTRRGRRTGIFRIVTTILPFAACVIISGCVLLRSSTIGDRSDNGQTVRARLGEYGIARLTVPEHLTSDVNSKLVAQCPSGILTNVRTELSMRDFIVVQWYTVSGTAICLPVPPPPPPSPLPPPVARQKMVLRGVHFDFNKATIRSVDEAVLEEVAETMKANPGKAVHVNGYTDAIGSEDYNLKLSQRRALAVAAYLENHGVPSTRLIPQGLGKTNFMATNGTPEGRAQNRRVELIPVE